MPITSKKFKGRSSAMATMMYNTADKLSGTARQRAIRKADDFVRYINTELNKPGSVPKVRKKRGGKIQK